MVCDDVTGYVDEGLMNGLKYRVVLDGPKLVIRIKSGGCDAVIILNWYLSPKSRMVTRVTACNYVKIATGQNFLPVLKIVTHTAQTV